MRTDIFAFGAVLYEMITGRTAFDGKSHASLIGAILKDQPPPISAVVPIVPLSLDRVIAKCLAKDPDDRWQGARDLRDELSWIASGGSQVGVAVPARAGRRYREWAAWTLLAIALVGLAAFAAPRFRPAASPPSVVRFTIASPRTASSCIAPANRSGRLSSGATEAAHRPQRFPIQRLAISVCHLRRTSIICSPASTLAVRDPIARHIRSAD
jgi:hypothetical protein